MRRSDHPKPSEREDLLLLGIVQDVAHVGDRTRVPSRRQRLDRYREWPVFSCRSMAGFGCPPRSSGNVFRDLGFSEEEAEHLVIRADLLIEIQKVVTARRLKQAQLAKLLRV